MSQLQDAAGNIHLNLLKEPVSAVVARLTHKHIFLIHILRCHLSVVHKGQHITFPNHLQYRHKYSSYI